MMINLRKPHRQKTNLEVCLKTSFALKDRYTKATQKFDGLQTLLQTPAWSYFNNDHSLVPLKAAHKNLLKGMTSFATEFFTTDVKTVRARYSDEDFETELKTMLPKAILIEELETETACMHRLFDARRPAKADEKKL